MGQRGEIGRGSGRGELVQEVREEDDEDGEGGEVADGEVEGREPAGVHGAGVRELVADVLALHFPSYEDDHEDGAESEKNVRRERVDGAEGIDAEYADKAEGPDERECDCAGGTSFHMPFLDEVCHQDLDEGDGGGHRCDDHHEEEDRRDYGAQGDGFLAHTDEHVREGLEDEAGAGARLYAGGEYGGHYGETGEDGEHQIGDGGAGAGGQQVLTALDVRGVGQDDAHSEGQGIEALAQGEGESLRGELREVRFEEVLHSPLGARHIQGVYHYQYYEYEKGRDGEFAEFLDAALDAKSHDGGGDSEENSIINQDFPAGRNEFTEVEAEGFDEVFAGPAAHYAVVGDDDERSEYRDDSQDFPACTRGEDLHRADGVGAAAPANHGFSEKDRQGQQEGAENIDKHEGGSAVFAYHIRESPDVSEADCRAGKCHNDGSAAAEVLSCRHNVLLTNFR